MINRLFIAACLFVAGSTFAQDNKSIVIPTPGLKTSTPTQTTPQKVVPSSSPAKAQDNGTITQVAASDTDMIPYAFPGIVGFRDGRLVGSDHLLNLSDHISVFAEISLPDNQKVPITAQEIEERVRSKFQKNGIIPQSNAKSGKPNLPFFHILIFVFSIPEGYIYNVSGRLFEEVLLPRINLPEGLTMQAITWDREGLRASAKPTFKQELFESVDETVDSFIERFKFFKNIQAQGNN